MSKPSLPTELLLSLRETSILQLQNGKSHRVQLRTEHSNVMAEVHLTPEQILIVKEPRHYPESAAARFRTCRYAAPLLERAGVLAPSYLPLPGVPTDRPMLAYWRIPLRTLREVWPDLSERTRTPVLRGYGALIRRLHAIRIKRWGPVLPDDSYATLEGFLNADLVERLQPAVWAEWPRALSALQSLIEAIPAVAEPAEAKGGVLNHNDLHMSNILCEEPEAGAPRCVGLLDLEAAVSMPPELDFARMLVYHGPLFGQPLEGSWFQRVWEGYGEPLNPVLLAFFRAYHLLNIGFHMSISGNGAHADATLDAASDELGAFN